MDLERHKPSSNISGSILKLEKSPFLEGKSCAFPFKKVVSRPSG
jgi:hypothetical protein